MRFADRLSPARMRAIDSIEANGKLPRLDLSQHAYALII
jgi:hypothetical protein